MKSSNPALPNDTFSRFGPVIDITERMTFQGVVAKTGLLLLFVFLTAGWTWLRFYQSGGNTAAISGTLTLGIIGGLIFAMATIFKPTWAPVTASLYALCEGLFLGGISAIMEAQFPGIAIQAITLTFGTLAIMLFAYQTGMLRATEKFKLGVVAATGAIALVYFVGMILSFFNISIPFLFGTGLSSIVFSLFIVVVAALNLILDFDFIEEGAKRGAPKFMEWYGSFALMVTLIWLYVEFLRLLAMTRSKR